MPCWWKPPQGPADGRPDRRVDRPADRLLVKKGIRGEGTEIRLIRFGSGWTSTFPKTQLQVRVGQKALAGQTILGHLP
jgi:hypothetical protein